MGHLVRSMILVLMRSFRHVQQCHRFPASFLEYWALPAGKLAPSIAAHSWEAMSEGSLYTKYTIVLQ